MNQSNPNEAPVNIQGVRNLFDAQVSANWQTMRENWYRWNYQQADVVPIHGSGATLQPPSPSTIGGYMLDANTEYLYPAVYLDDDYAGGAIEMLTVFETNESNLEGRTQDIVRLVADFTYKDLRPRLNRAVDPYEIITGQRLNQNGDVIIGHARRHQSFVTRHTFSGGDNTVLRTNGILRARINLCTAHSTISNVIINYVLMGYSTRKVHAPLTIPKTSE